MSTPDLQLQRAQARLGAASGIAGALLALIVNPLHGDLPTDPQDALTRVAGTATWGLLHLGIIASVVLILGGLLGLTQVPEGPFARALAQLSLLVALPGAALMIAGIAIDGFATKALADLWAAASAADQAVALRIAVAVEQVQNALFHAWAALFIGLPFLLIGWSGLLAGGGFPRWLGALAVVGGAGALCMGVAGFLHVPAPGLLFNVFALIVTLWMLVASVLVWRGPARSAVKLTEATSAV
jgi:hypothetical protein